MEMKHLQALLGIADTGSFSAAAVALGTVQSNVSAHVARLERELEVTLVDRASGTLTEEGELVVGRARRIMGEADALVADVAALRRDVVGTVRAGMIGTTGRWLLPQLYARLRARHPRVHLNVSEGTSSSLEPQVVSGKLHVAVVTLPVLGDDLSATLLFEEDLMLVVRADHPLAGRTRRRTAPFTDGAAAHGVTTLPLSALGEIELLLPLPGTPLRDEIDAAVTPAGVTLHASMELDGLRTIASLTFDGYGPAILPASAVPGHLRDRFRLLPLEGFPRRRVGVAVRRHGHPSAPTRAVLDVLNEVVREPDDLPDGLHPARPERPRLTVSPRG
jgi:DNA-binding transcriptional LysR family regulator